MNLIAYIFVGLVGLGIGLLFRVNRDRRFPVTSVCPIALLIGALTGAALFMLIQLFDVKHIGELSMGQFVANCVLGSVLSVVGALIYFFVLYPLSRKISRRR